ncbi:uncharacterized protein LOC144585831 [Pogona vitticeps]
MPLTRSKIADMSEVKDPQIDQGSEDEFGSVQGDSTGEQDPELRKILIAQQHELRVREMEEREREKQRQFELERERMAFELKRLELMNQNNNNNRDSEGGQLSKADLKKFPVYHKGDCPEVFFSLVERAFVDFSVRETEKMTIMRSLISGSLAEVYAEMPEERMKDFAEFKKLVFARHGINAEQLRQRFRSLTKKPEQTFTQVGAQLVRLLEKWLSQEGTETYEQLKDLIALEQFYSVLHGELKFQVRERKPKSVAAAAEIADFISQIRKPLGEGKSVGKPKETYSKYSQGPGKSQQGGGAHGEGKPSGMKPSPQNLEGKPKQEERESKYTRKCYFCQGKGHLISECEKLKQLKGMVPQNSSGTKPKAVFCVQQEQGSVSQREPVAMATQSGTATYAEQAEENGPLVEVKRCLLIKTDSQLFETAGVDVGILDRQYRGLRDTCSQVTLCHPDIIPREFIIPNESIKVAGIEGQVISLPVAEVPVNFQGWRGDWRIAISSTLPAAVLVGNDLAEHVKRVLVITRSQATTGTVQGGNDEPEAEAGGSSEAVVETLTTDSRFGQEQKADATLQKCFEQVFSNKPGIVKGVMHRIHTGDAPPQAVSPYRVTGPYRDKVRKELDEMLRENIIVPSSSPWSSPIVLVDKPDGSIRFCVDYRKLNRVTTPDAYPMPRLDNLIETIGGCRFISSLDLVKGYWQLRIDPRDQEKTAFCSPFGLYEFRVLSFGLRNAPATFQRLMDQTLAGLSDFTVAYIDDIGIFSNTWEDHLIHLELVLQRLSAAGLTVKASKCQLGSPEIKYLGHMVGGGVIKPLEAKIEAVRDWPRPNTKKKVKSFLGLVGYYRKFIPRFSEIAAPLTDLTRKKADDRIPWTSDCEAAFQRLKEALINYPVLRAPDFDREFIIYTNASNSGVGAVLCQEDENGDQHPVSYLSRKLQKGERHLATVEKECLAIVYAIQKAKPYIWGRHFVLCTDHSPLQWLKTMKTHNSKLMRWALNLQDYDFEVKVVRGSVNCVADALSRRPED